jgi:DNA repair protein RadD
MDGFESGEFNVLVSMAKLTTGYDNPKIDLIADFQPTNSANRHVQKGGRGTRPAPWVGKINCRYLGFAGNVERLGPINDPVLPRKPGERVSGAPIKICPKCDAYNHASARQCGGKNWQLTQEGCGYEFQFNTEEKIVGQASDAPIMKRDEEPIYEWFKVNRVLYSKFKSARTDAPACVKISYVCGVKAYDELARPEHGKALTERARIWWHARSGGVQMPDDVDGWLSIANMSLAQPKRVQVIVNRKYPEVVSYEF